MQVNKLKSLFCICIFLVLTISPPTLSVPGGSEAHPSHLVVQFKKNLLTVKAKDIPLKRVLKEIVDHTGIKIILQGPAEELVSAAFSDLPLEEGLRRLSRNYNYALVFGPHRAKGGEQEIEVFIFSKAGERPNKRVEHRIIAPEKRAPQTLVEASLDSLIKDLEDNDAEVREDAVDDLAELKDKRTVVHLARVLGNDRDPDIRETAADALGDLGGPEAIDSLIQALDDRDADVRESAVDSLGQIGGEEVVPPLMDALRDEEEDVREAAAIVLKQITGEDFGPESE